ncbi:MAG: hypothetical protein RIR91_987 [Verrucomicrobiota bacterium]
MIRGLRQACLLGGALWLPLFASAHNGEWLLAKCTVGADNRVTVRITADAEANPRIKTQEDLVRETKGLLLVHDGKANTDFLTLANQVELGVDDRLDPAAPLGHTPEELAKSYTLLKLTARANVMPRKFTFRLPENSPHTVILWLVDERLENQEPRWAMLIGGDESPLIEVDRTIKNEDLPWWQRRGWRRLVVYGPLVLLAAWLARWLARWTSRNVLP